MASSDSKYTDRMINGQGLEFIPASYIQHQVNRERTSTMCGLPLLSKGKRISAGSRQSKVKCEGCKLAQRKVTGS